MNFVEYVTPVVKIHARATQIDPLTGKLSSNHGWRFIDKPSTVKINIWEDPPLIVSRKLKSRNFIYSNTSGDYVVFRHSAMATDSGQSAYPYFDIQNVVPEPPSVLNGIGLYFKGLATSGGIVGFGVTTQDNKDFVNVMDMDKVKSMVKEYDEEWKKSIAYGHYKSFVPTSKLPVIDLKVEVIALVSVLWNEIKQTDLHDTESQGKVAFKIFNSFNKFIFKNSSFLKDDWLNDGYKLWHDLPEWQALERESTIISNKFREFREFCKSPETLKLITGEKLQRITNYVNSVFTIWENIKKLLDMQNELFPYDTFAEVREFEKKKKSCHFNNEIKNYRKFLQLVIIPHREDIL